MRNEEKKNEWKTIELNSYLQNSRSQMFYNNLWYLILGFSSSKKALNINVNRSLSDYYNNSMDSPLSIYFSFGFDIPKGSVIGKLLDFSKLYNQNSNRASKSDLYEVGLYKLINNDKVLISKTQTDIELNFSFNALEDGKYFIIAVQNSINNPTDDFTKNKFSVYNKNIEIV